MFEGISCWWNGTPLAEPESPEPGLTRRNLYPILPEPSPFVSARTITSNPTYLGGNTQLPDVGTLLPELSKLTLSPHSRTKNAPATSIRSANSDTRLPELHSKLPRSPFSDIKDGNPDRNSPVSDTKSTSNSLNQFIGRTPPKRTIPQPSKTPAKPKPKLLGPSGSPSSTPPVSASIKPSVQEEFKPPLGLQEMLQKLNSEHVKGFPKERKLLKHQVEARIFLAKSESSSSDLAPNVSAPGYGARKDVQMIARILDSKLLQKEVGPTLIVVPNCLINQWKEELGRFAPDLAVLVHHGADRTSKQAKNARRAENVWRARALMEATFLRIILDEAHRIKNSEAKTSKACYALASHYRWTVTGTPCQNGDKDYFSYLIFLQAKPYNEPTYFRLESRGGLEELKRFMKPFTLRRTKSMKGEDGKPLIELPPRIFKLEEVPFDIVDHKAFYDALQGRYRVVGNMYLNEAEYKDVGYVIKTEERWCEFCKREIVPKAKSKETKQFQPDKRPLAAKIHKMLALIRKALEHSEEMDKIIVYSQFTSYLDILETYVQQAGWKYIRYDGCMGRDEKETTLQRLNEDPHVRVALFSLKAGSVGLNLNSANVVVLMDPWWNPTIEDQAYDRVHRKTVYIHKLLIPNTIEERIEQLQHSKREIADFMTEEDTAEIGTGDPDQKHALKFLLDIDDRN
ncbi:hypothetical protein FRC01_004354 [Tulasnella sp. 417]|nr:hypothetical protein FRC01_004354 [Tulasnella sp. 417]